jgi:hypothetical protein
MRTMMTDNEKKDEGFKIIVPDELAYPEFANGFRILPQPGGDCILEFLNHVAPHNRAKAVTRVRVRNDFLVNVRDVINNVLPDHLKQQPVVQAGGQLVTPDGHGVAVFPPSWKMKDDEEGN